MNPGEIAQWEPSPGVVHKVRVLVPFGGGGWRESILPGIVAVFLRLDTNTRTIIYRSGRVVEGLPA